MLIRSAYDARALAASRLRHVGILLLGHDGAAGRKAIGKLDEAEALAHPDDEFFRQA